MAPLQLIMQSDSVVSVHTPETDVLLASEISRLRSACSGLEAECRQLADALAQSIEENAALRSSALLWIDLYERQLRRANDAIGRLELSGIRSLKDV